MGDIYQCMVCHVELPADYEPAMCCNGHDCGCMGMPTNPPICSEECWMKLPINSTLAPEVPGFEGTRDALSALTVRK